MDSLFDSGPIPIAIQPDQSARALEIHERLCAAYGCPIAYFHDHDPLSELISALLSHRTRNAESGRAFRALKAHYSTWELLRDAPESEVRDLIPMVTWPEQKAPRIQQVLQKVSELRGELSLEFLRELAVDDARAWLEQLPGVGPKTSAATLLFSNLRMPAMPVDSHHHRVAIRLALIPPRTGLERAHDLLAKLLPADWDAQHVYDHHEVLMFLGQRVCHPKKPACGKCPVNDLCPSRQDQSSELQSDPPPKSR